MSGICGICEPGRALGSDLIIPMLDAIRLPVNRNATALSGPSMAVGVMQLWDFQQVAATDYISLAVDADLVDFEGPAKELGLSPSQASSMPVTELIGQLYLKTGTAFLNLLHGGFCLALWDHRARRLILGIDRMGIKSLYFCREGERLLFGSRAASVRAGRSGPPQPNPKAILQFLLFSAVPAPLTSDLGMEKLRPGTMIVFEGNRIVERQYWDLEYPESESRDAEFWAHELRDGMRAAVHRHLFGCTRDTLGCYLSGGTDSSSIVAFTSEQFQPVKSFSIAFQEAAYSEIEFARTTANHFGTIHHERFLSPDDVSAALDKIIAYYDEPFANSSAIGSYYCALLARDQGIHTLLGGDGGDELFAGNQRYADDKRFAIYHLLPALLRRAVVEPIVGILPAGNSKLSLPRKFVRRANLPNPLRILSYGFFLSFPPREVFGDGFLSEVGADRWLAIPEGHFQRAKAASELNRLLYLDLKMTLADNDLRKVSGTAELAGVNVRYPLLDDRLAALSGRIPSTLKLKGFAKRYIFKQAMVGILPQKIIHKKKHGFGVPLAQWLLRDRRMGELMADILHDPQTRNRGYFRAGFLDRLMVMHREQPSYYGEIVWYLLALELWHRKHMVHMRPTVHAL